MEEVVRGKNEKCQICAKKFTLFNPEHVCKRCLRSVCKECGDVKTLIYQKNGDKKPHRLCSRCQPESQFLDNYKLTYKLSFASNSKVGLSWADQIARTYGQLAEVSEITRKSRRAILGSSIIGKGTSLVNKAQFWSGLNFSLRNLFGVCIDDYSDYYSVLKIVYSKIVGRGGCPYLCLFLLCHLNETKAVDTLSMIDQIIAEKVPSVQNVMGNLKFFGLSSKQLSKIEPFVEYIFPKFMNSLSLNVTTAEVSLFIISDYIKSKNDPKELQKGLASAIACVKDAIVRNIDNRKACQHQLVLNVRFSMFEGNMKIMNQKAKLEEETAEAKNSELRYRNSIHGNPERTQSVLLHDQLLHVMSPANDLGQEPNDIVASFDKPIGSSKTQLLPPLQQTAQQETLFQEYPQMKEQLTQLQADNDKLGIQANNMLKIIDQLLEAIDRN